MTKSNSMRDTIVGYEEALEDGLKQSCLKVKGVHEGKHQ